MQQSDERYTLTVQQIKELMSRGKSEDEKALFSLIGKVLKMADSHTVSESVLVANANMEVFDDLLSGKNGIPLGKAMQLVLVELYKAILLPSPKTGSSGAPGYVVRNVVTNALAVMNNTKVLASAREISATVIGEVIAVRAAMCGSMLTDIMTGVMKMIRGSDTVQRVIALRTCSQIVTGAGTSMGELHAEIVKTVTKTVSDKHPDVRAGVAGVLAAVAANSDGCTTVSPDAIMLACGKALEDDIGNVQAAFAATVGKLYFEQIQAYSAMQTQTRTGKNRGGANEDGTADGTKPANATKGPAAPRRSILPSMLGTAKKVQEDYDFKSVVQNIMRVIAKSQTPNGNLRAGYIAVLTYLLRDCMQNDDGLSPDDIEWLIPRILSLLHSVEEIGLVNYDDQTLFRLRLSQLIRFALIVPAGESGLKTIAGAVLTFTNGTVESRSEAEIQLALTELAHILLVMGDAAASVQDEVLSTVGSFLKDNSFGVRSAAAQVLTNLSMVVPALAAGLLTKSVTMAKLQVQELIQFAEGGAQSQAERMQRMFTFHGHALVISNFMKAEETFPTGLPSPLIVSVFDFGLDLLSVDVLSAPLGTRNITCSLVRAGALIVSSCLHKGYKTAKTRIPDLVDIYDLIFKSIIAHDGNAGRSSEASNNPFDAQESTPAAASRQDETLYEMMYMEAALVCLSSILWSCPEALLYEANCLSLVTDGLEHAFRITKTKYQPKFKSHFRFRTLHAILLECFAWLPPGSFPSVSQPAYMEALRVLRDCIAGGHECTMINQFSGDKDTQHILGLGNNGLSIHAVGGAATMSSLMLGSSSTIAGAKVPTNAGHSAAPAGNYLPCYPIDDIVLSLKLDQYTNVLSKKENEASLAVFSRDMALPSQSDLYGDANSVHASRMDWNQPMAPCAQLDGRLIDAAIALVAATFAHQSTELQDKSVQLCRQAVDQFVKQVGTSGLSLFSSDEERKKRDKKSFVTVKSVVCTLASIVKSFPIHHGMTLEEDLPWGQSLLDMLKEMLSHYNAEVQWAASQAIAQFSSKITGSHVTEAWCTKLSMELSAALGKDSKTEDMSGYCGHILAVAALATTFEQARKRNTAAKAAFAETMSGFGMGDSDAAAGDGEGGDDVRLHAMATVFDCLRKTDTSLMFRAYALFALGSIVPGCVEFVGASSSAGSAGGSAAGAKNGMTLIESMSASNSKPMSPSAKTGEAEIVAFIDRVWQFIELHMGCVQNWEESDLIMTSLQRLINTAAPYTLKYVPSKTLVNHFFVHWTCIRRSSRHPTLHRECAKFLSVMGATTHMKGQNNTEHVAKLVSYLRTEYLLSALEISNSNTKIGASILREVVPLLQALVAQCPHLLFEQQVDVLLFRVLDWCSSRTALPLRSAYQGVEMRTPYMLKYMDSVSADMFYVKHELTDCLRALAVAHCIQDNCQNFDIRAMRWVLYCRAVALGTKSEGGSAAEPEAEGAPATKGSAAGTGMSLPRYCASVKEWAANRAAVLPPPRVSIKRIAVDMCVDVLTRLISMQQRVDHGLVAKNDDLSLTERSASLLAHKDLRVGRARTRELLDIVAAQIARGSAHSGSTTSSTSASAGTNGAATESADTKDEVLDPRYANVPCFASLFIHDLVNAACACATYTLDDKLSQGLQMSSMQFLDAVVRLFGRTTDPDEVAANQSTAAPSRSTSAAGDAADQAADEGHPILAQFSSQLISALRPCLIAIQRAEDMPIRSSISNNTADQIFTVDSMGGVVPSGEPIPLMQGFYSPPLVDAAGCIVELLLRYGIVTDLVAVKRVLRLLIAFICPPAKPEADKKTEPSELQRFQPRACLQADMTDRLSIRGHVAIACNLARIFTLCTSSTKDDASGANACPAAVRTTIQSILREPNIPVGEVAAQADKSEPSNVAVTHVVWRAIIMDAARLLQKSRAEGLEDYERRMDKSGNPAGEHLPAVRALCTSSFSSGASRAALCFPHPLHPSWGTGPAAAIISGPEAILAGVSPQQWALRAEGVSGSGACAPGSHIVDAWPADDSLSDARRGGATYGLTGDPHTLRGLFNDVLPLCLRAYGASEAINSTPLGAIDTTNGTVSYSDEAIFTIALCTLQQEITKLVDSENVGHVLYSLRALAASGVGFAEGSEKCRLQWARLMAVLEHKVIPALLVKSQAPHLNIGAGPSCALQRLLEVIALLEELPFRAGKGEQKSDTMQMQDVPQISGTRETALSTDDGYDSDDPFSSLKSSCSPSAGVSPRTADEQTKGDTQLNAEELESGCVLRNPLWRCVLRLLQAVRFERATASVQEWEVSNRILRRLNAVLMHVARRELGAKQCERARFILFTLTSWSELANTGGWQLELYDALSELSTLLDSAERQTADEKKELPSADIESSTPSAEELMPTVTSKDSSGTTCPTREVLALLIDAVVRCAVRTAAVGEATEGLTACLSAWAHVATRAAAVTSVSVPAALGALVLQAVHGRCTREALKSSIEQENKDWAVAATVLAFSVRHCKQYGMSADPVQAHSSRCLLVALYPAALKVVGESLPKPRTAANPQEQTELAALQLLFLSLGLTGDGRVAAALALVVPAICGVFLRYSTESSATVPKLAGQGIVHIARTQVDAFRAQVALLSDSARAALQAAMREVLSATQQPQSYSGASQPAGSLKIDMAKFKK